MYEPAGRQFVNLAFFWPALAAASTREMSSAVASCFSALAFGFAAPPVPEPIWATPHMIA